MTHRVAYMPLSTYPDAPTDEAVAASVEVAAALGLGLHAAAWTVRIPEVFSPLGSWVFDVPDSARAAEERSRAEAIRLGEVIRRAAEARLHLQVTVCEAAPADLADAVSLEARYFDLSLLPCGPDASAVSGLAQAVVFGSGRPAVLVPVSGAVPEPGRIAVAWDESRVAARALGDALALVPGGCEISVLTVADEKPLGRADMARTLAAALDLRGYRARAVEVALKGRSIGTALQDAALAEGAGLLVMGGFGHSRLRDFVLGGATREILGGLRLPALLSH